MIQQREEWRPIPGYEGCYEASSCGRIRSVCRTIECRDGRTRTFQSKLLTPYEADGYLRVGLNNGTRRQYLVHRLVLLAFHGPPLDEGMEGDHFPNPDRQDNRPENLRWVTRDENQVEMNLRNYNPLAYVTDYLREESAVDVVARREGWDGTSVREVADDECPF